MAIVGGFDVHRTQITFDYLNTASGEVCSGQIRPATRHSLRIWLRRFAQQPDVAFAVEGCTGWRFVVEELQHASIRPRLAETADTATLRGRKKRAKTDRADARLLRQLLLEQRLPCAWIPPTELLEIRTLSRLYVALMAERRAWQQRIHAQLFHQGVPPMTALLSSAATAALAHAELSLAGQQLVRTALAAIDGLTAAIVPLRRQLQQQAASQPAVRALDALYGIGPLSATIIWAELGDCHRFSNAQQAVRFAGLDISVYASNRRRAPGRLARQGSAELRWALYEAAKCSARSSSPDYAYYTSLRQRLSAKQTALSVARKLARRCYHTLRELDTVSVSVSATAAPLSVAA